MSYFNDCKIHSEPEFKFEYSGTPDVFDAPSPTDLSGSTVVPILSLDGPIVIESVGPSKPSRHNSLQDCKVCCVDTVDMASVQDVPSVPSTQDVPSPQRPLLRNRSSRMAPFTEAPSLDLSGVTVTESSLLYKVRKMVSRFGEIFKG